MIVSLLAAVAGAMLTGTQVVLLLLERTGICLNDGCAIVDNLTTVDPIYFNLAGLLFFLVVWFGLLRARRGSDHWRRLICVLLLAALAAEAVLLSFQIFVAKAFCSYCLIILGLIVLCTIFLGLKQTVKGAIIFSAVMLTFAGLDFRPESTGTDNLSAGTMATFKPESANNHYTLFFSSTCNHCETIIEELRHSTSCAIAFNPVDTITSFRFPGAMFTDGYQPLINRHFLRKLDLDEVPVLLSRTRDAITIITGEAAIRNYLREQCDKAPARAFQPTARDGHTSVPPAWSLPTTDDGCSILSDCDAPAGLSSPEEPPATQPSP